ncbi:hypothetical protein TNCV_261301 [Trichonephila clavipes]|nr:hypothetical protein TNCV_261301 [Trichonephila clavipes]
MCRDLKFSMGRLCEWKHKTIDKSEEIETFEEYKKTLTLHCKDGHAATFYWMPDEDTPDLVYYQCFTHRNLGWKIHVVDSDAKVAGAMEHLSNQEPNSALVHDLAAVPGRISRQAVYSRLAATGLLRPASSLVRPFVASSRKARILGS